MSKEKVKIKFEVHVKKIYKLPERMNGSTLLVMWRRGSKKNSGLTKRALVKDAAAHWEEKFSFVCSLFRDTDTDEYEPKTISFALKEVTIEKLS